MRLSARDIEALQDLISSEGWGIFERMVQETYSTERLRGNLKSFAKSTCDAVAFGSVALGEVREFEAADKILGLPRYYIEQAGKVEARANDANKR